MSRFGAPSPSLIGVVICALLVACTAASDGDLRRRGASRAIPARLSFIRGEQAKADARFSLLDHDATRSIRAPFTALGLEARFDVGGMHLASPSASKSPLAGESSLTLRLTAVGRDGAMREMGRPSQLQAASNRLSVQHVEGLEEWWLNGPLGLEQGFELASRPAGDTNGALVLRLKVDGARIQVDARGGARLLPRSTQTTASVIRYTDLFAQQATGAMLPTEMRVAGEHIELRIDDRGARYPLSIDPLVWIQKAKLLASDGAAGEHFGRAVAIDGDYALVGAYWDDDQGTTSGSAYIFERDGLGQWPQKTKLLATDGASGDRFGQSVSISGNYALIGAPGHDHSGVDSGAVYVFERDSQGQWSQKLELLAADATVGDYFGHAVSVSGDYAIVGAYLDDDSGLSSGSAYIFERDGLGQWNQKAKLLASDGVAGDFFGFSVSVSTPGYALIGAHFDDDKGADSGSAYVFERDGQGQWTEASKLLASDGAPVDRFGFCVSVSNQGYAVIGAHLDDDNTLSSGSAYVFERDGQGQWTEASKLLASDGFGADFFGYSVAVSAPGYAVIGAYRRDENKKWSTGAAYMFERDTMGAWIETGKLLSSDFDKNDQLGFSVGVSGIYTIAGAHNDDDNGEDSGSAYIFERQPTLGALCSADSECDSGLCVDSVCCASTCGGGDPTDCQACSVAAGSSTNGSCELLAQGSTCRAAADLCDAEETCDGSNIACPSDIKLPKNTFCRAANGVCDKAELCDGISDSCPADSKLVGTICRVAVGLCDKAELCEGNSDDCPSDIKHPKSTICRAAVDVCDAAEECDGNSNTCPADGNQPKGTTCRPPVDLCDAEEQCTGNSKTCPYDLDLPQGTSCRPAVDLCDQQELCDGKSSACPVDAVLPKGTSCRSAAGSCDLEELCDGSSSACPADDKQPQGTSCRPKANGCDAEEQCDGSSDQCPEDAVAPAGTVCRSSAAECDAEEQCDGSALDCPPNVNEPDGTSCDSGNGVCTDGTCEPLGQGGQGATSSSSSGGGDGGSAGADTTSSSGNTAGPDESTGCGCRVVGTPQRQPSGLCWLLLALLALARRELDL